MYQATPATMRSFREMIDDKPDLFRKAISFFPRQKVFVMGGEDYRKTLKDDLAPDLQEWYQKKSFYLYHEHRISPKVFQSRLREDLISGFQTLSPLYHYLWLLKAKSRSKQ